MKGDMLRGKMPLGTLMTQALAVNITRLHVHIHTGTNILKKHMKTQQAPASKHTSARIHTYTQTGARMYEPA